MTCDEASDRCTTEDCPDNDGDGERDEGCGGTDCDDSDADRRSGATEVCDSDDEDCDETTLGELDIDGDGYQSSSCCNGTLCERDCDDMNSAVHPDEAETCNGVNDDCDTATDEGLLVALYEDMDDDDYGTGPAMMECPGTAGLADRDGDCDDGDPAVHPNATDFCLDGVDPDCVPGDGTAAVEQCSDNDNDGYPGSRASVMRNCADLMGYAPCSLIDDGQMDCDDASAEDHPGAVELCNMGDDENCNPGDENSAICTSAHAAAFCDGGTCTIMSCSPGYDDCDDNATNGCEADLGSTADCGSCDRVCMFGPHSIPVCTTGTCSVTCESGYRDCDTSIGCESESATDPANCGSCGMACPPRMNASPTCAASTCGFACNASFENCDTMASNGCETSLLSPTTCGSCTNVCPARPNASPTCAAGGACGFSCDVNYRDCDTVASNGCEIDVRSTAAHCGACGNVCPGVTNGFGVCATSTCTFGCNVGYAAVGSACVLVTAPRPISPGSTATTTTRRPTFRWALASGADGARLQICAQRACTTVEHEVDVTGSSTTLTIDLTPGVHFWRLFGRLGAARGATPSVVWEVFIPRRTTPRDNSFGNVADFNGDGLADLVVGAPQQAVGALGSAHVYYGAPTLPSAPSVSLTEAASGGFGNYVSGVGDVDVDGFADLLVTRSGGARAVIFTGSGSGVQQSRQASYACGTPATGCAAGGVGDVDGDGYADVVVRGDTTNRFVLLMGSASGLSTTITRDGPGSGGTNFAQSVTGGDLNGDGLSDVVVGAPNDAGGGRIYVYYGDASGAVIGTLPNVTIPNASGGAGRFGIANAFAGDLNGDGRGDLATGNAEASGLYVFYTTGAGIGTVPDESLSPEAYIGTSLAAGGDVDGDGFDDLIVGSFLYPDATTRPGRAYVFLGSLTAGISATPDDIFVAPDGAGGWYGLSVSGGDMDGDGFSEVVITSALSDFSGRARVYAGSSSGVVMTPVARTYTGPDGAGSYFGASSGL